MSLSISSIPPAPVAEEPAVRRELNLERMVANMQNYARTSVRELASHRGRMTDEKLLLSFMWETDDSVVFGDDPARYANCGMDDIAPSAHFAKAKEALEYPNFVKFTSLSNALNILRALDSAQFSPASLFEASCVYVTLVADLVAKLPEVFGRLLHDWDRSRVKELCDILAEKMSDDVIAALAQSIEEPYRQQWINSAVANRDVELGQLRRAIA